jgi:hypothetical protein
MLFSKTTWTNKTAPTLSEKAIASVLTKKQVISELAALTRDNGNKDT